MLRRAVCGMAVCASSVMSMLKLRIGARSVCLLRLVASGACGIQRVQVFARARRASSESAGTSGTTAD
eukprot:5178922-Lingulodinium_polyedra.AAC.1